jgi:hypothetical protein
MNSCGVLRVGYWTSTEGLKTGKLSASISPAEIRETGLKRGRLEHDADALANMRRNVLTFLLKTINTKEGRVRFTCNSKGIKKLFRKSHNLEFPNTRIYHRIS